MNIYASGVLHAWYIYLFLTGVNVGIFHIFQGYGSSRRGIHLSFTIFSEGASMMAWV